MYGIILFGKPGSGKSTIGKTFAEMYGYEYASSGDLARKMASSDAQIASVLAGGGMAPEAIMRSMVKHQINLFIGYEQNFVLDGFPRTVYQDMFLDEQFPNMGFIRVLIDVTDDVAINRCMQRCRDDGDNIDAVRTRIDSYHRDTEELTKVCSIVIQNNDDCAVCELADKLYLEVMDKCH